MTQRLAVEGALRSWRTIEAELAQCEGGPPAHLLAALERARFEYRQLAGQYMADAYDARGAAGEKGAPSPSAEATATSAPTPQPAPIRPIAPVPSEQSLDDGSGEATDEGRKRELLTELRHTSDLLVALTDRVRALEAQQRDLQIGSDEFYELAANIRELSGELATLSAASERIAEAAGPDSTINTVRPFGGLRRLLVVDDEETVRAMIRAALGMYGYDCTIVADAQTALALLEEDRSGFDLVLSDVRMPAMTGIELARHLRDTEPGLPVALMSAADLEEARESLGPAVPFLTKPFSIASLYEFVSGLLPGGTAVPPSQLH